MASSPNEFDTHTFSDPNCDSICNANSDSVAKPDVDCYCNTNAYGYSKLQVQPDSHAELLIIETG